MFIRFIVEKIALFYLSFFIEHELIGEKHLLTNIK